MPDERPVRIEVPGLLPGPGYSHVMRAGGLLFVSGQVALDADGQLVGPGDLEAQTRQVFRNIGLALEAGGASYRSLVKVTYFLTDVSGLAAVRAVRDEFLDLENPPASSLVEVSALFRPDLLVEIEAVALAG